MNDMELLHAARNGDNEALVALLNECESSLRETLRQRIGRLLEPVISLDDLIQITHTDAFLGIRSCLAGSVAEFQAWLATIAMNNFRDAARAIKTEKNGGAFRRILPNQDGTQSLLDALRGPDTQTPSRVAARRESVAALQTALLRLPDHYRQAVELYDLAGKPIDAVAQSLGRSRGAVHLLRNRAHEHLRSVLQEFL